MDRADQLSPPDRLESNKRSRESFKTAEAKYLASLGPKRVDPVEVLPLEVFGRILELGVDNDDPDFALRPSWVSVKWRAAALSSSPAWKSFSWQNLKRSPGFSSKRLSRREIRRMLEKADAWHERSKGNIKRCELEFDGVPECPLNLLFPMLDHWLPRLEILRMEQHCTDANHHRIDTCLDGYEGQTANQCINLHARPQDVRYLLPSSTCNKLRRLNTDTASDDDFGGYVDAKRLGNLHYLTTERVTISGLFYAEEWRFMEQLREIQVIPDSCFACGIPQCRGVRNRYTQGLPDTWPPTLPVRLPHLEVLHGLPLEYLQGMECPALVDLEIDSYCGCGVTNMLDPTQFFQKCHIDLSKLERLFLSRLQDISGPLLEKILPRMRKLYHLEVLASITNAAVEALTDPRRCPELEILVIRDARGLTGGPILRMIDGRLNPQNTSANASDPDSSFATIQELQLLNCDMLEKVAEDWLKRNVPKVIITHVKQPKAGYRDKMVSR
jgi:hypothetical protein